MCTYRYMGSILGSIDSEPHLYMGPSGGIAQNPEVTAT